MMDDFATRVTSMPMETAVHCMLDQIAQMFETDAHTHYSGGLLVDWGQVLFNSDHILVTHEQVPYIRGGYSYPSVAEPADARTQLSAPVVDTLFFAGNCLDSLALWHMLHITRCNWLNTCCGSVRWSSYWWYRLVYDHPGIQAPSNQSSHLLEWRILTHHHCWKLMSYGVTVGVTCTHVTVMIGSVGIWDSGCERGQGRTKA